MHIKDLRSKLNTFKNSGKFKDSVLIGALGGLIGTIAMDISNLILKHLGKTEILYAHLTGSILMRPFRTKQKENFVLGEIFHIGSGIFLGIPVFYLFKKTGKDYYLIKGGIIGGLTWSLLYIIGQSSGLFKAKPHMTKTHYSALWNNILYGLVTAQTIVSLTNPKIFPEKSAIQASPEQLTTPFDLLNHN